MSVLNKKPLKDLLPVVVAGQQQEEENVGQMHVCGLALDFCVVDTAVNYASFVTRNKSSSSSSSTPIWILSNESRAAHIPGFGKFGSGFLTDPKDMVEKMQKNGIAFKNL